MATDDNARHRARARLLAEESREAWEAVRADGDDMLERSQRKRFERDAAQRNEYTGPRYTVIGYRREDGTLTGRPNFECQTDLDAVQLVYTLASFIEANDQCARSYAEEYHVQIYEDGRLVWDDINNGGFMREYNDVRPADTELLVTADFIEERSLAPNAVALLRHHGKEITIDDSVHLCELRERFFNERFRLARDMVDQRREFANRRGNPQ